MLPKTSIIVTKKTGAQVSRRHRYSACRHRPIPPRRIRPQAILAQGAPRPCAQKRSHGAPERRPRGVARRPWCRHDVPGRAANFARAPLSFRGTANKIPSLRKKSNAALRQRWQPIATTGHVHQPCSTLNRRLPCAGARGPSKHPRAAGGCRWRPHRGVPP